MLSPAPIPWMHFMVRKAAQFRPAMNLALESNCAGTGSCSVPTDSGLADS